MRMTVLLLSFCFLFSFGCKNGKAKKKVVRDTTINNFTSFNELFLDSIQLHTFLQSNPQFKKFEEQFEDFYKDRNYGYAWFDSKGLAEQAYNFHNLLDNYIAESMDSSLYDHSLETLHSSLLENTKTGKLADSLILKTELLLTGQFFQYASKVYKGSDINAAELGWFIPRKKIDLNTLLDSTITNKARPEYITLNPQYKKLQTFVQTYTAIEKKGALDSIPLVKKSLRSGDSADIIISIKERLQLLGDLKTSDNTPLFDTILTLATKRFQSRMGLTPDGVIGNKVIAELNVPIKKRIHQLLINLERLRWLPIQQDSNYILVNIPGYSLHVFDKGRVEFSMNVIVGTAANNTVIFSDKLKYVVFSPYWNVPESIVRNEILPGMRKNSNYLAKHNMEITKPGSVPVIRQKPGPANSLGLVKFLFPNNYNIYLHDTPNRNLFSQTSRSFSHGCIRISDPKKMAAYLLRNDPAWNSAKIDSAMHLKKEKWVPLKKTIPVFIVYFTAWVDQEGLLHFRKDIYKHDEKMAKKLFSENLKER